ncbi:hypothetical protein BDD12DRAFT_473061 [Trichophaea hybrida]|nr:hypothetical protein BDD12DRAFT_473061 [Trichophaea hybrida]
MTAFTATISILKNVRSAIVFPYHLLSPVTWLLSPFLVLLQFGMRSLSLLLCGPISVLSHIKVSFRICLACIYADSGPTINFTASLSDRFSTSTADRPPLLER